MAFFYPDIVSSSSIIPCHKIESQNLVKNPAVINKFSDGNKQIIILNKSPVGESMRMTYDKLTDVQVKTISDFYNLIGGKSNSWYFPLRFTRYTGLWLFASSPTITPVVSNNNRGVYNVSMDIINIDY